MYIYIKSQHREKLHAFRQRYLTQVHKGESLLQERSSETYVDEAEQYSPARTVRRGESLLFDFELSGHH